MTDERSETVNIEAIMQQIRRQILAQKGGPAEAEPIVPVEGKRFPPEFYEHLYHAGMAYDRIGVKMNVTPVNIPLIGKWIERIRSKLHELVLYYVNQVAAEQISVNHHLLQAISILSREFEQENE